MGGAVCQLHLAFLNLIKLQLMSEGRRNAQNVCAGVDQGANDLGREPTLAWIAESEVAVNESHALPLT